MKFHFIAKATGNLRLPLRIVNSFVRAIRAICGQEIKFTSSGLRPVDSLAPTRWDLRAFASGEFLLLFPKQLKSPHPMRRRNKKAGETFSGF